MGKQGNGGKLLFSAGALGLLLCLLTAHAAAQEQAQGRPLSENQIINNQQIESFAKALMEIDRINDRYAPRLSGSFDENKDAYISAEQEMLEAIRKQGLTLPEYHRITGAVIADEVTYERVVQKMTGMQQAKAGIRGEGSGQAAQ